MQSLVWWESRRETALLMKENASVFIQLCTPPPRYGPHAKAKQL